MHLGREVAVDTRAGHANDDDALHTAGARSLPEYRQRNAATGEPPVHQCVLPPNATVLEECPLRPRVANVDEQGAQVAGLTVTSPEKNFLNPSLGVSTSSAPLRSMPRASPRTVSSPDCTDTAL